MYFVLQEEAKPSHSGSSSAGLVAPTAIQSKHSKAGGGSGSHAAAMSGRVLDVSPDADPLLGSRAAALVASSPAAALRYATRLAEVAAAAGRPLAAVRALSCYSLNGGPHRSLYDATVDLLHYARPAATLRQAAQAVASQAAGAAAAAGAGAADGAFSVVAAGERGDGGRAGGTAVSRWVHDYDTAPRACDPYASPHDRPGLIRRSRSALAELQAAAGLWVDVVGAGGLRRVVCWDAGNGPSTGRGDRGGSSRVVCDKLAYLWG